ncbi:vascular endothelial growth factor B isoform X2 [Crotalus tigris]|uniref:vascular endothelial growth factor B isoform X2 n=1 Tax=Crotalus tigris TaxID=88082 RepID=UPI00192F8F0A|nr:vascular endothelial growth factor B isoform X2 [Crotalus tigris]
MNAPCGLLCLLLVAAWQLPADSPTTGPPPKKKGVGLEKGLPAMEVIRFLEVYNRSVCQPKETMVSVTAEHPSLGSHIMIPSCVVLSRCTGCCSDDSLNCVPRRSREVILEVMASLFASRYITQLTFEEHLECMCRPRTVFFRSNSISRSCAPCRDRKKQPDPHTCKCVCRHRSGHCERRGLKFSEKTCRCVKRRRRTSWKKIKSRISGGMEARTEPNRALTILG